MSSAIFPLSSLYDEDQVDIKTLVIEWVERFKTNEQKAFFEIISLLYITAGVKIWKFSEDDKKSASFLFTRIMNLRDIKPCQTVEEKITKFVELIDEVMFKLQGDILHRMFLVNYYINTLTEFSTVKWKSFRIVAAAAGTRMISYILCMLWLKITELESIKVIIENDKTKMTRQMRRKLKNLSSSLQNEMDIYKMYISNLMNEVITKTRKAKELEVRSYCYEETETWLKFLNKNFHVHFEYFASKYFHLLYYLLNEPNENLRNKAIKMYFNALTVAVDVVLEQNTLTNAVRRMSRLIYDINIDVRVTALKCFVIFDRVKSPLIDQETACNIYYLIYNQKRDVAVEAAVFVHNRIVRKTGLKCVDYISELADFHIEAEDDQSDDFLIDALLNTSAMLTDWHSWLKLLIGSSSSKDGNENYVDGDCYKTEIIIRLMVSCLKQSTTGMIPFNRIQEIILQVLNFIQEQFKSCNDNIAVIYECARTYSVVVGRLFNSNLLKYDEKYPERNTLYNNVLAGTSCIVEKLDKICCEILKNEFLGIIDVEKDILRFLALSSFSDIMECNIWNFLCRSLLFLLNNNSEIRMEKARILYF
ncbi:cohesin subunit SA-1-like [Lycorma delicatula]|uniref:cohesin subunit SA-1-like n=1 Tax=Lycorma delicatula TaxID=130591 RepID=UPI003F5152AD